MTILDLTARPLLIDAGNNAYSIVAGNTDNNDYPIAATSSYNIDAPYLHTWDVGAGEFVNTPIAAWFSGDPVGVGTTADNVPLILSAFASSMLDLEVRLYNADTETYETLMGWVNPETPTADRWLVAFHINEMFSHKAVVVGGITYIVWARRRQGWDPGYQARLYLTYGTWGDWTTVELHSYMSNLYNQADQHIVIYQGQPWIFLNTNTDVLAFRQVADVWTSTVVASDVNDLTSGALSVAVQDNNLYVFYEQGFTLYGTHSSNGTDWSTPESIYYSEAGLGLFSHAFVRGSTVYVTFWYSGAVAPFETSAYVYGTPGDWSAPVMLNTPIPTGTSDLLWYYTTMLGSPRGVWFVSTTESRPSDSGDEWEFCVVLTQHELFPPPVEGRIYVLGNMYGAI